MQLKQRRRGASDAETLLSIIFNLCAGNGYLSDMDSLHHDCGLQKLLGIRVLSSRRAGEYLSRFDEEALPGLMQVARQLTSSVIELPLQNA